MKRKNVTGLFSRKRLIRVGSVILAAAVLGVGAWNADSMKDSDVPQLTSFIDLDDLVHVEGEDVPLGSAPKVSTKTKISTKVVMLKRKSAKTYTKKLKPKKVKSPTITKTSGDTTTTTKKETTSYVTEKYKKNSKKKQVITTKKIKTTVTTVKKKSAPTAANSGGSTAAKVNTASSSTVQSSAKQTGPYKVPISTIAPRLDERVLKAYQNLHFEIIVDSSVSYAGFFDARNQSITLREESDTVYHEIGHFVAFIAGNVDTKSDFNAIYQEEKNTFTGSRRVYASQNPSEFFAETFREYTLDPVTLKNTCPKTYEAIVKALSKITDSQVNQAKMFYGSIWKK